MPTPPIPKKTLDAIRRDRKAGLTVAEVARKHGVSFGSVSNATQDIAREGESKAKAERAARDRKIHSLLAQGLNFRQVAEEVGCSKATAEEVGKRKVTAAPEPGPDDLPEPTPNDYGAVHVADAGRWLVLGDCHVPNHDRATIEAAVTEARRRGVVGVLLNGDVMDAHEVSCHDKDPSAPRYVREVELTRQFLRYVRKQLPKARVVYKEGNHEERLERYVIARAPALFDLEFLNLSALLHAEDAGVEWVTGKRPVMLGLLPVLHGHEYRGQGGVNPARWLYLKAHGSALCGHFHRTSTHGERDVRFRERFTWTVGCACHLHPQWFPLNSWNHGAAFVEVAKDGTFAVDNLRMNHGRLA